MQTSAVKDVLKNIREKMPEEAMAIQKYVDSVREKNIAVLGEDEAFKLIDSEGEIRAFRSVVRLSAQAGTLVQPVPGGPYVVSAQGYEILAEATGTIVMNAPHVLVDGKMEQNPHVMRDEKNGRILAIYCRAIAFRYSSKGIPQVSDRTTIFDVPAYRLIDLLSKAKKFPQAFRLLPVGMDPESTNGETWARYSFDENTCLWINTAHEEALQFYAHIINREKKAIDFAQTFAQRNAVKHLLGLQAVPGQKTVTGTKSIDHWELPVICWRPTSGNLIKWDSTRYAVAQGKLEALAGQKGDMREILQIEASAVDVSSGHDHISDEPEGIEEMIEEEDRAAEILEEQGTLAPEPSPAEDRKPSETTVKGRQTGVVFNQLHATQKAVPEIYEQALKELKIDPRKAITKDEGKRILARCNEIANEEGAE